ncbi:MAG: hypothetical protein MSC30_10655 [Gaiellaceae bacterium MAG52_C11]|nr:hypothetical protein [Candidatus Gaiellasilicea maunaloa]
MAFGEFAERFVRDYLPSRNLKPTTTENYRYLLGRHLLPFADAPLAELEARPELLDAYIALKSDAGLSPKTIQNHLLLLNVMFRRAIVWRLIRTNPVASIDRPRMEQPEMSVLSEAEIARLSVAYEELVGEAAEGERAWWLLAKAIVVTALGTALRRGELIGLRWRSVNLLDGKIEVREAFVRGQSRRRRAERRGASSSSARARWASSTSSGAGPRIGATMTSSSATRRRERRSTRASSRSAN